MKKFRLLIVGAERTELSEEMLEKMKLIDQMQKDATKLIEMIRLVAQPVEVHRREGSLVTETKTTSERLRLVTTLREVTESAFAGNANMTTYMARLADAHKALFEHQVVFWKQVEQYCVKPLKLFIQETCKAIKDAFIALEKARDDYDAARHQLKKCKIEEIEICGKAAAAAQMDFEKKANELYVLLEKLPEYQISFAKASYTFCRAEMDYGRRVIECFEKIPAPGREETLRSKEGGAVGSKEGGAVGSKEGGAVGSKEGGAVGSKEGGAVGSKEGGAVIKKRTEK